MTNVQVVTAAPPLAEKETTIHGQRGAGDEGGIIRTEEDHRVGDFVGGTKPAERYVGGDGREPAAAAVHKNPSSRGVAVGPGATSLMRMRYLAASAAAVRVSECAALLLAL